MNNLPTSLDMSYRLMRICTVFSALAMGCLCTGIGLLIMRTLIRWATESVSPELTVWGIAWSCVSLGWILGIASITLRWDADWHRKYYEKQEGL